MQKQDARLTPGIFQPAELRKNREQAVTRAKKCLKNKQICIKTENFSISNFFLRKTQVLARRSIFKERLQEQTNFSTISKKIRIEIFQGGFLLYRTIGNFHVKES